MAATTGRSTLADPERHRAAIASNAERFVIVGIRWGHLGANVPNEFIAQSVRDYAGRAVGLACVDPNDPGASSELEHSFTTLGLQGLKLSPVYQGFDPWSAGAWKIYEICDHYRKPILFHQAAAFAQQAVLEWGNPILLDKVARTFPDLKITLAHFGQPWAEETVQMLRKHKQIFSDLSARYYRRWQLYNALMHAIDYDVTDQLLFGSDFPMQSTAQALAAFRSINDWGVGVTLPRIPETTIEDIINNRPLSLLGW